MLTAAPPPNWARDKTAQPTARLQAHFVSHRQIRLLYMHTAIPPGTDRAEVAGAKRLWRPRLPARASVGTSSTAQPQGG